MRYLTGFQSSKKDILQIQRLQIFFPFASAQIYSSLHFRLTTCEAKENDCPALRLSDALQTIAISRHDYAQHIKSFSVTLSMERDALETARFLWHPDLEPSKAMNTTLLIMIRRAKAMETFSYV